MSDYRKDTVQHLYESGFRELVVTGVGEVEARDDRISDLERRNGELEKALRGLNGAKARLELEILIAQNLIEDPNYEMSATDFDYEAPWHDKLKAALTRTKEQR